MKFLLEKHQVKVISGNLGYLHLPNLRKEEYQSFTKSLSFHRELMVLIFLSWNKQDYSVGWLNSSMIKNC